MMTRSNVFMASGRVLLGVLVALFLSLCLTVTCWADDGQALVAAQGSNVQGKSASKAAPSVAAAGKAPVVAQGASSDAAVPDARGAASAESPSKAVQAQQLSSSAPVAVLAASAEAAPTAQTSELAATGQEAPKGESVVQDAAEPEVDPMEVAAPPTVPEIAPGTYVIKTGTSGAQALSVDGGNREAGESVSQRDVDGTYDQLFYLEKQSSGKFGIFSLASGLALDASSHGASMQPFAAADSQLFTVKAGADGAYTIQATDGRLLTMASDSKGAGVGLTLLAGKNAVTQLFRLVPSAAVIPGVHAMHPSSASSSVLSASSGTDVQVAPESDPLDQKYVVAQLGDGSYSVCSMATGLYVAVAGNAVVQSDKPFAWSVTMDDFGDRRCWNLVDPEAGKKLAVPAGVAGTVSVAQAGEDLQRGVLPQHAELLEAGRYAVGSDASGRALSVRDDSWLNGAMLQAGDYAGSGGQVFDVSAVGFGVYSLVNAMTRMAVSSWGSDVQQRNADGGTAQQWFAILAPNGALSFACVADRNVLSVGSGGNGQAASMAAANGSKGQLWRLRQATYVPDAVLERAMSVMSGESSQTSYCIAVDLTACRTVVFYGSRGNWRPIKNWDCGVGAPTSPTVVGDYLVTGKGYAFWGDMGGTPYTCYYYTQFYGDYLFHSYPCDPNTFNVQDSRNEAVSHGCVRLPLDRAQWLYDVIPYSTFVKTYY